MSYDNPEDREGVCRLAIFMHKPEIIPPGPDSPTAKPEEVYTCIFFDLLRTKKGNPRNWRDVGGNVLSFDSMRPQSVVVCFKDDEPELVDVHKWEFWSQDRAETLHCLKDADGLVIVQDVGKAQGAEIPNYAQEVQAILGLVAEARGSYDPANPREFVASNYPIPVTIMGATMGGRIGNSNKEALRAVADKADWGYAFVSDLKNEDLVAQDVFKLTKRIWRRGVDNLRLVPGVPIPSEKLVRRVPKPIPPAVPETPATQTLARDESPTDTTVLATPGDPLGATAQELVVSFPNPPPTLPQLPERSGSPKPTQLPIPGVDDLAPPLPTSVTAGTLTASGSSRSLRPSLQRGASTTAPPSGATAPKPAPPPTPGAFQDYIGAQPIASGSTAPPRPARPHTPPNFDDDMADRPYYPKITTAGYGGNFLDNVERYKQNLNKPPAPPPKPRATESTEPKPDPYFDMEGDKLRERLDSTPEKPEKPEKSGLFGSLGRSLGKGKGKAKVPPIGTSFIDKSISTPFPVPKPLPRGAPGEDLPPIPYVDPTRSSHTPPLLPGQSQTNIHLRESATPSPNPAYARTALPTSTSYGSTMSLSAQRRAEEQAKLDRTLQRKYGTPPPAELQQAVVDNRLEEVLAPGTTIEEPEIKAKKRACCVMM